MTLRLNSTERSAAQTFSLCVMRACAREATRRNDGLPQPTLPSGVLAAGVSGVAVSGVQCSSGVEGTDEIATLSLIFNADCTASRALSMAMKVLAASASCLGAAHRWRCAGAVPPRRGAKHPALGRFCWPLGDGSVAPAKLKLLVAAGDVGEAGTGLPQPGGTCTDKLQPSGASCSRGAARLALGCPSVVHDSLDCLGRADEPRGWQS